MGRNADHVLEAYNVYLVSDDLNSLVASTLDTFITITVPNNYIDYCFEVRAQWNTGESFEGGYGVIESEPSNIACANAPVVEINFNQKTLTSGVIDTIDILMNNASAVGSIFLEIEDSPDVLVGESVITTERTNGWSFSILDDNGKISIAGFGPLAGADPLQPGDGPVCRVVITTEVDQPLILTLTITDGQLQTVDNPPQELYWSSEIGQYPIEIDNPFATALVTFQADMSQLFSYGFDPSIHTLELRGPMNGWSGGDELNEDLLDPYLYAITKELTAVPGDLVEWKFKANPDASWNNSGWETSANRTFVFSGGDSSIRSRGTSYYTNG